MNSSSASDCENGQNGQAPVLSLRSMEYAEGRRLIYSRGSHPGLFDTAPVGAQRVVRMQKPVKSRDLLTGFTPRAF